MIKRTFRIIVLTIIVVLPALWFGNWLWVQATGGKLPELKAEVLLTEDLSDLSSVAEGAISVDKQAQIKAALAPYHEKLTQLFAQTLYNGDLSQYKNMSYDEDWCIASTDLREADLNLYRLERDEWLLSRGYAPIWNPDSAALQQDDPRFWPKRNQHLIPYEEMPHDELTERAFNNDFLALVVLNQRPETHWKERTKISSRLVFLGDTTLGLSGASSRAMYSALNKIENGQPDEAYELIYQAFAFAEYGMIRGDNYVMTGMVEALERQGDTPETRELKAIIATLPSDGIKQAALRFMDKLNRSRAEQNLPPFEAEAPTKVSRAYQLMMYADFFSRMQATLNASWFPARWKEEYFAMTPCRERHIKKHQFNYVHEPAIYAEVEAVLAEFR